MNCGVDLVLGYSICINILKRKSFQFGIEIVCFKSIRFNLAGQSLSISISRFTNILRQQTNKISWRFKINSEFISAAARLTSWMLKTRIKTYLVLSNKLDSANEDREDWAQTVLSVGAKSIISWSNQIAFKASLVLVEWVLSHWMLAAVICDWLTNILAIATLINKLK